MRQAVLVDQQNAFDGSTHPDLLELITHPLETGGHRRILLEQRLLRPERVVCQWISENILGFENYYFMIQVITSYQNIHEFECQICILFN